MDSEVGYSSSDVALESIFDMVREKFEARESGDDKADDAQNIYDDAKNLTVQVDNDGHVSRLIGTVVDIMTKCAGFVVDHCDE